MRKGAVVDREMRDAFSAPPPLDQLDEEQTAIVANCRLLEAPPRLTLTELSRLK